MHMENEASVNEPQHGEAKQAWRHSVIVDTFKSLLFSTRGQHTFQKTIRGYFNRRLGPQMTLKRRSFPCLLWRSQKVLKA